MSRMGCSHHCRACGTCFSSLKAFDLHRQFEEGHQGDWDHRLCVHPLDDARFAVKTGDGVCNLARPKKPNTRIWTVAKDQQDWALRKRREHLRPSAAESDLDHPEAA